MINFDNYKDFELETTAHKDYTLCYATTKNSEVSATDYLRFSGNNLKAYLDSLEDEFNKFLGIEVGLEVDNETGNVTLFTFGAKFQDEEGGEETVDVADIHNWEDCDVITFLRRCNAPEDVIKKVIENYGYEEKVQENDEVEVEIKFTATVKREKLEELKKTVEHHLDGLCDFESWDEITNYYNASLTVKGSQNPNGGIDVSNFEQYMNPPEGDDNSKVIKPLAQKVSEAGYGKTVYASVAVYTGDGSVNAVIFSDENDAIVDCKQQFEKSIADGKVNGDFKSATEWDESSNFGTISWTNGDTSTFTVQSFQYYSSSACDEVLCAEFDQERLEDLEKEEFEKKCEELKRALFIHGNDAISDFLDIELSGFEEKDTLDNLIDDAIAQMPDDVFDSYYKAYAEGIILGRKATNIKYDYSDVADGKCTTCKNYGRCNVCSDCNEGSEYQYDAELPTSVEIPGNIAGDLDDVEDFLESYGKLDIEEFSVEYSAELLAKDMIASIDHVTCCENPGGSGYFTLSEHKLSDGTILNLIAELCKYQDDCDGHEYYGLYSVAEIDGGDNITEGEWSYTDNCDEAAVSKILQETLNSMTRKEITSALV